MAFPRLARPADAIATPTNPVASQSEPSQPVVAKTKFAADKSYRVRLSGPVPFGGGTLSPMHVHTVTGAAAQEIRASIAAFDLA